MCENCETYVIIFCDGTGGYSTLDEREKIVSLRRVESEKAYEKLGIKQENILRMDYPDFSLRSYIGWIISGGEEGTFARTIRILRKIRPTRLLIPNEYREHTDHEALSYIGSHDGPQVGDPTLSELGKPFKTKGFLKYSV